ncbi:MAG TPA: hypothetical protein VL442_16025 [Mucilaginibacter sp.]|nr:hypothetical protein [Mucilaginibacter sp.]
MNKIIPASPTAAALGKYGDVPVSFYNGTPNISIPLYDISTVNHNLKIAMFYDATGTKVLQNASWVGLGWSLSAGGAITRIVRQQDDFIEHGYYRAAALPDPTTQSDATVRTYLNDVYDGYIDAEPDIYSYNFCGLSGRFVLGKKADGSPVFLDEKNNLKIEYNDTNGKWVITTAGGYKYTFGTTEISQNYDKNTLTETTNLTGVQDFNIDLGTSPTTAWYLDNIVAPTGEAVTFTYVKGKSLSLVSKSENYFRLNNLTLGGSNCSPPVDGVSHYYSASRQAITDVYLKQITFATGSIEFNTSARADVEYISSTDALLTPSKLDNIIIKDYNGVQLKKYVFSYTYFHSGSLLDDVNARLKLDAITEYGSDNSAKSPYVFSYIHPNDLPDKNSKGIDHWGYYNGAANGTLLPADIVTFNQPMVGANREPDETELYPTYGVLNKIKYPTGGSTSFDYELNDFSNLHDGMQYKYVQKFAKAESSPLKPGAAAYVTFTISPDPVNPTAQIPVTTSCNYEKVNNDATDIVSLGYANMRQILGPGNSTNVGGCTSANYNETNPGQTFTNRLWDPGDYSLEVLSNQSWSFFTSASWKQRELIASGQRIGGGIRVKRITDEDAAGHSSVKRYVYADNTGKSTGVLLTYPKYDVTYQTPMMYMFWFSQGQNTNYICEYTANYTQLSSSSLYPSGLSSHSGIVGYSKVTELSGENGENGKTEYYFHNQEEYRDDFPGMPISANPFNGKPDTVKYYTAQNTLLKEEDYQYAVNETSNLKGVKLFLNSTFSGPANGWNGYNYYIKFYDNNSYWAVNTVKSETQYNSAGPNTTITNFTYANNTHRAPTLVTLNKSDGSQLITKYKRPGDYISGNSSFAAQMVDAHIISPVIEQQTLLLRSGSTQLLSGTFTSYQKYNNAFFKPDVVYQLETSAPLADLTESSFTSAGQPIIHSNYKAVEYNDLYDLSSGNLLSRHLYNGPPETYFWGYNNQYPIAKIIGTDYNTAKPYVDVAMFNNPSSTDSQIKAGLNALRSNVTTEKTQVSTYTFAPLIGVTSSTDPRSWTTSYEYDSFQRLMNIKDKDGNIIKHYDYHYKQ